MGMEQKGLEGVGYSAFLVSKKKGSQKLLTALQNLSRGI